MATQRTGPSTTVLDERTADTLVLMARRIYPHDRLPDEPYIRVVEKLDADARDDPGLADTLRTGVEGLQTAGERTFGELSEEQQIGVLERIEDTAFFQAVRSAAVVALYDQPAVWQTLGYEGPSFDRGGYLRRGFDDIDWL